RHSDQYDVLFHFFILSRSALLQMQCKTFLKCRQALSKKLIKNGKETVEKAILKCKQPPDIAIISGIILYLAACHTFNQPFETSSARLIFVRLSGRSYQHTPW